MKGWLQCRGVHIGTLCGLILVLLGIKAWAQSQPTLINDQVGVVQPAAKRQMQSWASDLEKKTGAQIAVLVIQSTGVKDIAMFAVETFEAWGIGRAGEDNGVLVLIAIADRKAFIATGYGLEGAIPDITASRIVNEVMVPHFRHQNYSQGILDGYSVIVGLIANEYQVMIAGVEEQLADRYQNTGSGSAFQSLFTILFLIMFILGRGFFFPLFLGGGYGRGRYWSSGSRGGFGGGFGGFGGGMTGGGGGGGSW